MFCYLQTESLGMDLTTGQYIYGHRLSGTNCKVGKEGDLDNQVVDDEVLELETEAGRCSWKSQYVSPVRLIRYHSKSGG